MFQKLITSGATKAILFYLAKYKKDFTILSALSIVSAVTNAIVPYLAGRVIDSLITQIFQTSLLLIGIWFLIKLVADVIDKEIAFQSERVGTLIHADYIMGGINKILELPLSFHKSRKIGEIFDKITRATEWLERISQIVIDLTPQLLSILVALVITFTINPILSLVLIGALFLYVLVLVRITPALAPLQRRLWTSYNRAYGTAFDTLLNVQAVKQATAERWEKRRVGKLYSRASSVWVNLSAIWQNLNLYQKLLVSGTQLAIFILSIFFIRAGTMTIGELVMFNGYAAMIFGPFVILSRNWQTVQNGITALNRTEHMLTAPTEAYEPKGAVVLPELRGEIEFKDVSFRYTQTRKFVLDGVNFKVEPGQTVALVGESGVGKTTLIDLISLYYRPTMGKIYVDGHDIAKLNLRALRSQIAVVPQEVILFNDTLKVNIKYGRFGASDQEVVRAARLAHADEFIEGFPRKYNQVVGERGIKLSTGQKQRIAIARAILREPGILILDEPTSALDSKSEKFITESFNKLMKGRTTFIIAHRLSTVRVADMILVLDKGKIIESGRHEELIKIPDGVYRRLYELQIGLR